MTLYPDAIDNSTTLPPASGDDAVSVNALIAAVIAVETELGILPAGVYADVRTRLDILETRIGGSGPSPTIPNPFFIGNTGVSIGAGFGVPSTVVNKGSFYLRQDGGVGQVLYYFADDGSWHQVGADINGATVPLGSGLTTGNVLQVNGSSSLTYAPVNLAGGANYVTGLLPTANQVVQTMGGDISGTTATATVTKIQGVVISGTPASGYVLEATSPTAASWQAPSGAITLAGDVTGAANANTVVKIHGTSVPATPTINQVLVATSGTSAIWQQIIDSQISVTADIAVSKLAPGTAAQVLLNNATPTPTWTSISGDVTLSNAGVTTVTQIHGASVPASGALTTGNVLQVNGSSSLIYGAINLAGGNNFVTGTLPIGNQASQTMGGDISGTTAAATVTKIQGNPVAAVTLGATQDGYVATWVNSGPSIQFKSTASSVVVTMGGDVTGLSNASSVVALRGKTISATPPTVDGYVLTYVLGNNDLEWQAAAGTTPNSNWLVTNWYIDPVNGFDGYSGQNSVFTSGTTGPIKTWKELIRRFGTDKPILRQNTIVTFMSSQSGNTDPVIFHPYLSNGASCVIQGTTPTVLATISLTNSTLKNRATGQLNRATLGASGAQYVLLENTTHLSRAWTFSVASGSGPTAIWNISQPLNKITVPGFSGTVPNNSWVNGDSVNLLSPVAINVVDVSAQVVDWNGGFNNGLTIYQCVVYDPTGIADEGCLVGAYTNFYECLINRELVIRMLPSDDAESIGNCYLAGGLFGGKDQFTDTADKAFYQLFILGGVWSNSTPAIYGIWLNGDIIISGNQVKLHNGGFGYAYISGTMTISGTSSIGDDGSGGFFYTAGAQIWGPGIVNTTGNSQLFMYGQNASSAIQGTITLELDGYTTASAYNPTGIGINASGISITPASIDAQIGSGGFGGTAFNPGGSSITTGLNGQVANGTLTFNSALISPTITQASITTGANNLTLAPQQATSSGASGSLIVNVGAPATGTTEAGITLERAGTQLGVISQLVGVGGYMAMYFGNVVPSGTNYSITGNNSVLALNASAAVDFAIGGATQLGVGTSQLSWTGGASSVTNPLFRQIDNTVGTGQTFTIQAQNATSGSNNGGNLVLTSGTGTLASGIVQLQAGGTTIAQASSNKFTTLKGSNLHVTATTISYAVLATDDFIAVGALSAPITITLPSSPTTGDTYKIKDTAGSALANNITVSGNGANIDGATTFVISVNYTFISFVFSGLQWSVC